MEGLNNIITQSLELFFRYGIRSVSMDDIARELGMSKKTLYQYVENKAALVDQVTLYRIEQDRACCDQILDAEKNAIDEIVEIGNFVRGQLHSVNSGMVYDLKKYYAKSWKRFEEYKRDYIYRVISDNLRKGIEQGMFRERLNVEVITKLYLAKMDAIMDAERFPMEEYNLEKLYIENLKYHIYGIASTRGAAHLDKLVENIKKQQNAA